MAITSFCDIRRVFGRLRVSRLSIMKIDGFEYALVAPDHGNDIYHKCLDEIGIFAVPLWSITRKYDQAF